MVVLLRVGRLQYMIVLGSLASKKARGKTQTVASNEIPFTYCSETRINSLSSTVVQLWQLAMHMQWALIAQEALPGLWHLAILQEVFPTMKLIFLTTASS